MNSTTTILSMFLVITSSVVFFHSACANDACSTAANECNFFFEFPPPAFSTFELANKADVPFTTRVSSRFLGVGIGMVHSNGPEPDFIMDNGAVVPITEFGFAPTHFKPYPISSKFCSSRFDCSAIGHQALSNEKLQIAKGKCIRMYLTSYQVTTGEFPIDKNNNPLKPGDCLVFKMK